jgi:DNA polymerase III subunit gamma/tau
MDASAGNGHLAGMSSYLVLARKYRPSTFTELVGQDHVVQTLSNSILSGRVAHAFLFCGVRGVGKTTVARILAKSLNCTGRSATDPNPCNKCSSCKEISNGSSVDVQEIDGASNTSVENIREINENIKYPPVSSLYKIIIIDEVHMISINAFNALLKTLEEPPSHAKFIFATTESHKVPATINSRCQRFNFRTISIKEISEGMARILAEEKIEADEDALALVAREAQGSFRDALSLLDQVIAFSSRRITTSDVINILGIAGIDRFGRLMEAIIDRDPAAALAVVHELFHEGYDPEQFVMDMIQYARNLIVAATVPRKARADGMIEAPLSELEEMERLAERSSPHDLQNFFSMLLRSEGEIKRSGNPWVTLEMTVLKMAYAPEIVDLSEIIRRIDSGIPPSRRPEPDRKPIIPKRKPPESKPSAAPPISTEKVPEEMPAEQFTITKVTPLPSGTPDEVWLSLKELLRTENEEILISVMEHGNLLAFGPTEVEIGFNKKLYKDRFEARLAKKPELRQIFEDFFGGANIKTLTLAQPTSLAPSKPYAESPNGESDFNRALKNEAMDNPITKAALAEFEGSFVEDIKILATTKP